MPFAATLYVDTTEAGRLDPRRPVDHVTTVRGGDGTPHLVQVANLSTSGCFVETRLILAIDQSIRIGIAGVGAIPAHVVRQSGAGYGCQFDTPLSASQVEHAFSVSTIAPFPHPDRSDTEEIDVGRWPGAVRAGIVIGLATAAWGLVLALTS